MSVALQAVAVALALACVGFGLAAAVQARAAGWSPLEGRGPAGPRALALLRYRMLSRRAGALALVLMLASKCAQ